MNDFMVQKRKRVHVAVAVIRGADGRVLVAKRPMGKHMAGYWEFPGGKVELGETVQAALARELLEEVGIMFTSSRPLIRISHNYPDKSVLLDTWEVSGIQGEPSGAEGQEIQWVFQDKLSSLEFPEANKPIIKAVQLPDSYMVTGRFESDSLLFSRVAQRLQEGIRLVQFRAPWLEDKAYLDLARRVSHIVCESGGTLLIKGEPELLSHSWCQGIHLRAAQLYQRDERWLEYRIEGQVLAASCHNERELELAAELGVDFVTISPVKPTHTHPEKEPLGVTVAEKLTDRAVLPTYWLGGLTEEDYDLALRSGAQGIAAIGCYWN